MNRIPRGRQWLVAAALVLDSAQLRQFLAFFEAVLVGKLIAASREPPRESTRRGVIDWLLAILSAKSSQSENFLKNWTEAASRGVEDASV